jgi:hypothetical protein
MFEGTRRMVWNKGDHRVTATSLASAGLAVSNLALLLCGRSSIVASALVILEIVMIHATETKGNLDRMLETLETVMPLFTKHNQISVTARHGAVEPLYDAVGWIPDDVAEADYSEITAPFIGTAFERFLKDLPFAYGRTRLMRMRPKSCLSIHADPTRRYHMALITNPDCYIVGVSGGEGSFHQIPADGVLYEMDAHRTHTAMNSGNKDRFHLVICPADPTRPMDAEPIGRTESLSLIDIEDK